MAFKLASLFVEIGAKDNTVSSFTGVHARLKSMTIQLESLQQNMLAMFVGLSAGLSAVEYNFMGFESAMHRLGAVAEATDAEFTALEHRAREMGRTTIYGATAAARAMTEFALQGFNARETYDALPSILKLGIVGMMDLADATRIASGVMRGMGLEVQDLPHVVDALAATAAKSATDVSLLGESFKAFGPIALLTGATVNDVSAALGILANNMIRGQSAGTALRNIYQRTLAPTAAVSKSLKALNIDVTDGAGKMKPLAVIIDELNEATKGMTDQAKAFHLSNIAGLRSMTALTVLLQNGGDALRKFSDDLNKSGEYSKKIAALQNATLASALKRLGNNFADVSIKIGELLEPAMRSIIGVANQLIELLRGMSTEAVRGAGELGILATAMAGLVVVGTAITKAFFALTSPLGLVLAVCGLIATVFLEVGVKGDNLGEKINNLSKDMSEFVKENRELFHGFFITLIDGYSRVETVIKNFGMAFDYITASVSYHVEKFAVDVAHYFFNVLPHAVEYWIVVFGSNIEHLFGTVVPAYLRYFVDQFVAIWIDIFLVTKTAFANLGSNIKNFLVAIVNFIKGGFTGAFDYVWQDMLTGFQRASSKMPAIAQRAVGGVEAALKAEYDHAWDRVETDSERRNREMAAHLKEQLSGLIQGRTEQLINKLFGFDEINKKIPVLPDVPGKQRPKIAGGLNGLEGAGKNNSFVGIEELARKIQVAAVGGSVPDQQLAEQKKGNDHLKKVNNGLKDIQKTLEKGVGLRVVN